MLVLKQIDAQEADWLSVTKQRQSSKVDDED